MVYVIIVIAAVAAMAAVVYIRFLSRRHVALLFRSTTGKLMAGGAGIEPAMRDAISQFSRRAPFNLLEPEQTLLFIHVLLDLESPVDVGAEILQRCEDRHSIENMRDLRKLTRLAYSIELKLKLEQLIQNAKTLHKDVPGRYPNITIALLASLSVREGWSFVEEQNDALIFDYRQERIRIPKQGSGKDATRLILFEELAHSPMLATPEAELHARKSARQELIDNFDAIFDETFMQMSSKT